MICYFLLVPIFPALFCVMMKKKTKLLNCLFCLDLPMYEQANFDVEVVEECSVSWHGNGEGLLLEESRRLCCAPGD